jgi:hypothetical protein
LLITTLCFSEDKVLAGETKLCLTTSSLGILATNFRRYSERQVPDASEEDRNRGKKTKRKDEIDIKTWQENIRTMYDFVIKVKALKVSLRCLLFYQGFKH